MLIDIRFGRQSSGVDCFAHRVTLRRRLEQYLSTPTVIRYDHMIELVCIDRQIIWNIC